MRAAALLPLATMTMALDAAPLPAPATDAPATLHLAFEGLRSHRGTVRVCVFPDSKGFPDCQQASGVVRAHTSAAATRVALDVAALPPGDYAISVIHDENDNNRLDKSFIGLPTEGVGFSNNASAPFGPPGYGKTRFVVDGETTQTIRLKYYL